MSTSCRFLHLVVSQQSQEAPVAQSTDFLRLFFFLANVLSSVLKPMISVQPDITNYSEHLLCHLLDTSAFNKTLGKSFG